MLFTQLGIPQSPAQAILDFGSGLGVTANHFAAWHDVLAVEPNKAMTNASFSENEYRQMRGGIERITELEGKSFDVVFCHNVLGYIENKEPVIKELLRVLKPGGVLSVGKHNRAGRVFGTAVFKNDPRKALSSLDSDANDKNDYLGTRYFCSNGYVSALAEKYGGKARTIFGIRVF